MTSEHLATGILRETSDGMIVLSIPNTDYRLHLVTAGPVAAAPGERLSGRIDAVARRIDRTQRGGLFIDPVYGRPRNIQGRIVDLDAETDTIIVRAPVPMHVKVRPPQKATDFQTGEIIGFAVDPGATMT